jgi:acetyltransferase-like isoleucine patch superfamily enzyme
MGETIMGIVEEKYGELLKIDKTSSILEPVNYSLAFARSPEYLKRLNDTSLFLHVVVPSDMDKEVIRNLPECVNVHIIDDTDNVEYVFTYIHNEINKDREPKENIIGKNVRIHETVVFGVHGNTYCRCPDGSMMNMKHMGNIVVEDNVDIEALSVVHRAGMTSTIIGEGTKICVKCNIGHNCIIGTRSFISPGVLLGGGTTIGKECYFWQGVITRSNISICDYVIIGAGSIVMHDITTSGVYYGSPAKYVKPYDGSLR